MFTFQLTFQTIQRNELKFLSPQRIFHHPFDNWNIMIEKKKKKGTSITHELYTIISFLSSHSLDCSKKKISWSGWTVNNNVSLESHDSCHAVKTYRGVTESCSQFRWDYTMVHRFHWLKRKKEEEEKRKKKKNHEMHC